MAFIPVPGVVMAELVFNTPAGVMENTLYFTGAAAWTETLMNDLAEDLKVWWDTNMAINVSNTVSLTTIRVTDLSAQDAPGIEYVTGLPIAGDVADVMAPGNVTFTTTFITALRGRNYRGRNYFVGINPGQLSGIEVPATVVAEVTAAYGLLDTQVTANTAQHVVVSRYLNNAPRAAGVATPVTAYRTENTWDSQRRRLAGRGQ